MTARTYVDPFDPRAQVLTPWVNDPNAGPSVLEDEDSLRRSHGLSRWARRVQRRPVPIRVDEPGYERNGRYHADKDGVA